MTDDAQMVEEAGHPVYIVPGSDENIKITTPDDIRIAKALLK
ncbi:2-C-methyl-D-erythritol 4-phosphate cytidylyltransferase [Candidatus Kuenenia stuttgartensis]|nr:2-C-methyl-D-erythritol 4-phosphate cytidylyltransferase [Candidatus Kuenenia stuttgartiensis]